VFQILTNQENHSRESSQTVKSCYNLLSSNISAVSLIYTVPTLDE